MHLVMMPHLLGPVVFNSQWLWCLGCNMVRDTLAHNICYLLRKSKEKEKTNKFFCCMIFNCHLWMCVVKRQTSTSFVPFIFYFHFFLIYFSCSYPNGEKDCLPMLFFLKANRKSDSSMDTNPAKCWNRCCQNNHN